MWHDREVFSHLERAKSLVLIGALALAGCSDPVLNLEPEETVIVESTVEEHSDAEVSAAPEWQFVDSPDAVDLCKIPDGRPAEMQALRQGAVFLGDFGMSNVGFPASPDRIPISGESRYVAVAVSFPDMPGDPANLDEYLAQQTQLMTEWSEFWSQGNMRYEFELIPGWVEVESNAEDFRNSDRSRSQRSFEFHAGLAGEVATAIGSGVDWENIDGILAVFPLSFDSFPSDWNGRGDPIVTPTGVFPMFYYGGGAFHMTDSNGIDAERKRELLWSFWIHEILHSQSWNLHAPANGWPVGLDRNQYSAGGNKFSGAVNAWELFKVGWILDSQIHCVDARSGVESSQVMLTPLEIYGGERKITVVRTGEHSGLLVESRRPIGYTQWAPEDSGIMVYRLDTTVMNDRSGEGGLDCGNSFEYAKWAYYVPPEGKGGLENACSFEEFVFSEGDSVIVDGVTIELVYSDVEHDYVAIWGG